MIYPGFSYVDALDIAGLTTLAARREESCHKFIDSIQPSNPLYNIVKPSKVDIPYNLRSKTCHKVKCNTDRFKNFVTVCYSH